MMLKRRKCAKSFKLRHQVPSTTMSTSFLTPLPLCGHPLLPSSTLANAHKWANLGQARWHQQSHAPPHCHLSAAAPMLPAPARQQQQDGRVEGDWGEWVEGERETGKVMTMQCATHTLHCLFLSLYVVWWCSMQPTRCIIYLIPSILLMMQCATHTPHCLFLSLYVVWWCGMQPTCHVIYFFPSMMFDDAVCNPHAPSSISFPPCRLMMQHATHMPHCLFLSLHVVWWCGVQPICHVVYFFLFLFLYILLDFIRNVLEYNL